MDRLTLPDHSHLDEEDECYFLGEYTAKRPGDERRIWQYSPTNNLIINFKKAPRFRGTFAWQHKVRAMQTVERALRGALPPEVLDRATLVPIPPSKVKGDPEYDNRMTVVLRAFLGADVRELLVQRESTVPVHESGARLTPDELFARYYIDDACVDPPPRSIALFDDLLTAGAHFKAAKHRLQERFPDIPVAGYFIARRLLETVPPEELLDDEIQL